MELDLGLFECFGLRIRLRTSYQIEQLDQWNHNEYNCQEIMDVIEQTSENQKPYAKSDISKASEDHNFDQDICLEEAEETNLEVDSERTCKRRIWNLYKKLEGLKMPMYFVLCLLFYFSLGCEGSVMIEPKSTMAKIGNDITFHCTSDGINQKLWEIDDVNKSGFKPLDGTSFVDDITQAKYSIRHSERDSALTIHNIREAAAGTVICREDGYLGKNEKAKLSVAKEIRCLTKCDDDHLLVACFTSYWSEDVLHLQLQYKNEIIKPISHVREPISDGKGTKINAVWNNEARCVDQHIEVDQIIVTLTDNYSGAKLLATDFTTFNMFDVMSSEIKPKTKPDVVCQPQFNQSSEILEVSSECNTKLIVLITLVIILAVLLIVTVPLLVLLYLKPRICKHCQASLTGKSKKHNDEYMIVIHDSQ